MKNVLLFVIRAHKGPKVEKMVQCDTSLERESRDLQNMYMVYVQRTINDKDMTH